MDARDLVACLLTKQQYLLDVGTGALVRFGPGDAVKRCAAAAGVLWPHKPRLRVVRTEALRFSSARRASARLTLGLLMALLGSSRSQAAQYAYVTTQIDNSVVAIDTDLDAMIDAIPLSLGTTDFIVAPDGRRGYAVNVPTQRSVTHRSGSVTVIDLISRTVVDRILVGLDPRRAAITRDGRFMFVAGLPSVQIDLTDDTVRPVLDANNSFVPGDVKVSQDGRYAYFATVEYDDRFVGLVRLDITTGAVSTAASSYEGNALALDPNGRFIYLLGNYSHEGGAGRLFVLDSASLHIVRDVLLNPDYPLGDIVVTPDGSSLYISAGSIPRGEPTLYVVDPLAGTLRTSIQMQDLGDVSRLAIIPDGGRIYVSRSQSHPIPNQVSVIDTVTQSVTASIPTGVGVLGIAASPDGASVYAAAADGVHVINTATQQVVAQIPGLTDPTGIAASRDGRVLYVAGEASGSVGVVDIQGAQLTHSIQTGGSPLGIAVSPDGERVYVTSSYANGAVFVIDARADAVVDTIPIPGGARGIALTPDGSRLLVANYDAGAISVIDTKTDQLIERLGGLQLPEGIAVSSDGSFGLVGLADAIGIFGPPDQMLSVIGSIRFNGLEEGATAPCAFALRRDGSRAYAADVQGGHVYSIDPQAKTYRSFNFAVPLASNSCGIALTPDEQRVYVANYGNDVVTVLDSEDLHVLHHVPVLPAPYDLTVVCSGGCPSPPSTRTGTPTATPLPTTTPEPCVGDCSGDGAITIGDLITGVRIASGELSVAACPSLDVNRDGQVTIDEVVRAVRGALEGCGPLT